MAAIIIYDTIFITMFIIYLRFIDNTQRFIVKL